MAAYIEDMDVCVWPKCKEVMIEADIMLFRQERDILMVSTARFRDITAVDADSFALLAR